MPPAAHGRCRAARYTTARLHGWQFALQCCRLSWSLSGPVLRGQGTPLQEEYPSKGPSHTWLQLQTRMRWRTHPNTQWEASNRLVCQQQEHSRVAPVHSARRVNEGHFTAVSPYPMDTIHEWCTDCHHWLIVMKCQLDALLSKFFIVFWYISRQIVHHILPTWMAVFLIE